MAYNLNTMDVSLCVDLAPRNKRGLRLANPVIAASGTAGYGDEGFLPDIHRLGAIVCKGTTLLPREGNPQPRLAETPSGLLNAVGLENIGVRALIRDKAPTWAGWQTPVIVNIAGETVNEYAELAGLLDGVPGVAALEVNISCPNVQAGCIEFGQDPTQAARVTEAVRQATSLPILVKLTPNTGDIVAVARAVVAAGADAVSLINTVRGMAIDAKKRRPVLSSVSGGLSGPAIKPIALHMVYQVAAAVSVPVVGGGGIDSAADALEFIMAGATAVQIGSAALVNRRVFTETIDGLEEYLKTEGVADIRELTGIARRAQ